MMGGVYYADPANRNKTRIGGLKVDKIFKFKFGHWQYYDKNKNPLKDHINAKYMQWVNE